jgi:hypothetical protein
VEADQHQNTPLACSIINKINSRFLTKELMIKKDFGPSDTESIQS